mgnify:CR=1 FL=1
MKIFYDHQIFCNQNYGGPSRYFVSLVEKLKDKNLDIKISAPLHINEYLKNLDKKIIFGKKLFFSKYISNTYSLKNKISLFNSKINKLYLNHFKPDVVHFTYYDHIISNNSKIKKVVTIYDLIHEKYYKDYGFEENYLPKKKIIDIADKIICISENTKKDLIEIYKVNEKRIFVTHLSSNEIKNKSLKKLFNFPYILFVGSRWKYKNFYNLLKMLSEKKLLLKNFKIVLFGGGNLNKYELSLIQNFKLDVKDFYCLNGNDETLNSCYKYASAFIYPSLYEGFGLPILEAFSNNCPVVCSDNKVFREVAGEATEYFDPNDTESMYFMLNKVLESEDYKKIMIEKGIQQNKKFSWEKCANLTKKIYQE